MMLKLHVPIFRWIGHVELSWKTFQRDRGAWKTKYKGKFMRIKKKSKYHVFLNRNGEHIVGSMIHLNKNKTKWKSKTKQNWSKLNGISTIYVIQFVKTFTIYYIKCVCSRIWVARYVISNFKVLGKQSFSICFSLASWSMRISFHSFCKICMANMNISFAWYLHVIYLHYKYINTPRIMC
jgi:hypothetical protein